MRAVGGGVRVLELATMGGKSLTAPSYLNAGTYLNTASATSMSPALPTGRVNGNILIATVRHIGTAVMSVGGGGWQALGSQIQNGSALRVSQWWRVVDGTEAAPTVSWTGALNASAQIHQYSRENYDTTSPFGTIGTADVGATATHTSPEITTTRDNSLVIYIDVASANTALATPSGWTEDSDTGATGPPNGRMTAGSKTVTVSGTATGNISVTGAATNFIQRQIELLAPL